MLLRQPPRMPGAPVFLGEAEIEIAEAAGDREHADIDMQARSFLLENMLRA